MTDDPRADYRDADDVLHRWDPDLADWYHPAGIRCRDESCPGNRGALERLGGMPPGSTEADAHTVRASLTCVPWATASVLADTPRLPLERHNNGAALVRFGYDDGDDELIVALDPVDDEVLLDISVLTDDLHNVTFNRTEAIQLAAALLALVRELDRRRGGD